MINKKFLYIIHTHAKHIIIVIIVIIYKCVTWLGNNNCIYNIEFWTVWLTSASVDINNYILTVY